MNKDQEKQILEKAAAVLGMDFEQIKHISYVEIMEQLADTNMDLKKRCETASKYLVALL